MQMKHVDRRARFIAVVFAIFLPALASAAESRLALTLDSGRAVDARVLVPEQSTDARMPAVMLFGGFERGASALDLIRTSRPTVLASFDYPLDVPEKARGMDYVRMLPAVRRGIRDSFDGIGKLHAYLATRPDVDPTRITIVGVSLGAPFAVVAAVDHDIPGLAVIHGFGRVNDVIAHQFIRRWGGRERGFWVEPAASLLGNVLTWYADIPQIDIRARNLRDHQRAWMLSAQDDELMPARATDALREGLDASAAQFEFETEPGGHLRGGDDPRIPALLGKAERWMARAGLN